MRSVSASMAVPVVAQGLGLRGLRGDGGLRVGDLMVHGVQRAGAGDGGGVHVDLGAVRAAVGRGEPRATKASVVPTRERSTSPTSEVSRRWRPAALCAMPGVTDGRDAHGGGGAERDATAHEAAAAGHAAGEPRLGQEGLVRVNDGTTRLVGARVDPCHAVRLSLRDLSHRVVADGRCRATKDTSSSCVILRNLLRLVAIPGLPLPVPSSRGVASTRHARGRRAWIYTSTRPATSSRRTASRCCGAWWPARPRRHVPPPRSWAAASWSSRRRSRWAVAARQAA